MPYIIEDHDMFLRVDVVILSPLDMIDNVSAKAILSIRDAPNEKVSNRMLKEVSEKRRMRPRSVSVKDMHEARRVIPRNIALLSFVLCILWFT